MMGYHRKTKIYLPHWKYNGNDTVLGKLKDGARMELEQLFISAGVSKHK